MTFPRMLAPYALATLVVFGLLFGTYLAAKPSLSQLTEVPVTVTNNHADTLPVPEAGLYSTPLNNRFEAIDGDPYCMMNLGLKGTDDWTAVRSFFGGHFYDDASTLLAGLQTSVNNANATLLSACAYGQEIYALVQLGEGEEMAGYALWVATGSGHQEVGTFLLPLGYITNLSTQLFAAEDLLGISARVGDASFTDWIYLMYMPNTGTIEQVEMCHLIRGGGWTGQDEPSLNCDYTYNI